MRVHWFLLFSSANCFISIKTDLIITFLNEFESKFTTFFLCWSKNEKKYLFESIYSNTSTRFALFPTEKTISELRVNFFDKLTFIIDMDCPDAFKLLQKNYFDNKFRNSYQWLIIYNAKPDFSDNFWNRTLRFDTTMKIAVREEDSVRIFDLYKPGRDTEIKMKVIALFENKRITYADKVTSFYESRKHLGGVLLRTGSTYNYSFETEEEFAKELRTYGERTFDKFNFQLFLTLRSIHQFGYNTTFRNAYFGNTTSGIDSGVAQLVYEKQVDISTSGGFIRFDRIDFYDFLVPVYKFRTCFIFVNPGKTKPGAEVLKPFSANTWYALILIGLFMGVAVKIASWIESSFSKATPRYSLYTSLVIIISVFAQQGSAIVPHRFAGRVIFFNLLIFSMIIYNYYTSSLVSSLLSSVPEAISTVKELYESNLKVALEPRPYTLTYIIQQRNDPYISLLNSSKIYEGGKPNYMPPSEGISKVRERTYAYHTDDVTAYSWLVRAEQELICDLAQINFLPPGDIGFVMQKKSEYTELFQISLRKMQTSGIYSREKQLWVPKKPVCLLSTRVKAVGFSELFLVYLTLCGGISLAVIILFLEIISKRSKSINVMYVREQK